MDEKKFTLPIVGSVLQRSLLSRFTTTFSTLLQSGIPAMEALSIVSQVMDNSFVSEQIARAQQMVGDGLELSQAFERQSFFPPLITFMMNVGEKSGNLPELLEEMGNDIEEELEIDIQKMVSVLEPLIIVGVALIVIMIIMPILLPMLEMSRSFR
jgi:type II secretory pathway component PulF